MRDDECHASLGPRRVLLVVGLHRRDPRPWPGDDFLAVYDDVKRLLRAECSAGQTKVNSAP